MDSQPAAKASFYFLWLPLTSNATLWKTCGTLRKFFFLHSPSLSSLRATLPHHSLLHTLIKKSHSWADHHNWVGRVPHKLWMSLFSRLVVQGIDLKSTVLQNSQRGWRWGLTREEGNLSVARWSLSERARQHANRSISGIFIFISRVNSVVGLLSVLEWGAKTCIFYACKCSQWLRCTERSRASVMLAMRQRRRILI